MGWVEGEGVERDRIEKPFGGAWKPSAVETFLASMKVIPMRTPSNGG